MRKIRIFEHISLDGVIQPGGPGEYNDDYANGGWTAPYRSPAGLEAVLETQGKNLDLLLGRRTYDLWAGYWPKAGSSPMAYAYKRRDAARLRRDSQAGKPRMGASQGLGHGHLRERSRDQIEGWP